MCKSAFDTSIHSVLFLPHVFTISCGVKIKNVATKIYNFKFLAILEFTIYTLQTISTYNNLLRIHATLQRWYINFTYEPK